MHPLKLSILTTAAALMTACAQAPTTAEPTTPISEKCFQLGSNVPRRECRDVPAADQEEMRRSAPQPSPRQTPGRQ